MTVGHFWSSAKSRRPTIIIIKTIIYSTTTNTLVRDDPPTPARGSTPAREISPFRGEALAYYPRHFPIPAFPPYAVRTPHIHGATDYGATII